MQGCHPSKKIVLALDQNTASSGEAPVLVFSYLFSDTTPMFILTMNISICQGPIYESNRTVWNFWYLLSLYMFD